MHTYTLHDGVMVQNVDCDSAGLFVSLCLIKTWRQHEYHKGKKKKHICHSANWAVLDVTSKDKKKLITKDIFWTYFPELIPLPHESDESGGKAWVSLGLVEL